MSLATSNIFSALDTKRKKKSSKTSQDASSKKRSPAKQDRSFECQQPPATETKTPVSNWADTDEEDDFEDDIGPLPQSWVQGGLSNGSDQQQQEKELASDSEEEAQVEEIHEALGLEIAKDDDEEEEDDSSAVAGKPTSRQESTTEPSSHTQQALPEKQLSKKEQKRLELEEMNRVLAELGIQPTGHKLEPEAMETNGVDKEGITEDSAHALDASAAGKRKKKKDKDKKKVEGSEPAASPTDELDAEHLATLDPAEAKKLVAKKKAAQAKKGAMTSAATIAAREAKERAAKKSKVKDKKNYNQAPTR